VAQAQAESDHYRGRLDEVLVERDEARAELADAKTAAWYAFVAGAKWWEFESTKGTMWQSDVTKIKAEAFARYPYAPHGLVRVAEIGRDQEKARADGLEAEAAGMRDVLRKVPICLRGPDPQGCHDIGHMECSGCESVSCSACGRSEPCKPGCWVSLLEAAIDGDAGRALLDRLHKLEDVAKMLDALGEEHQRKKHQSDRSAAGRSCMLCDAIRQAEEALTGYSRQARACAPSLTGIWRERGEA